MIKIFFLSSCAIIAVTAAPALAQNNSQSTIVNQQPVSSAPATATLSTSTSVSCELHIWPAARVAAITQGAGASFGLVGALIDSASHADQNKRDKTFITAALDAPAQAKALRQIDLPKLLNLPPVNIVSHDQGIELKSDDVKRLSDSTASCYYDIVIRGLIYLKTATTKGKMRTFIAVRQYDGATNKLDYKDSENHALDVKLPKEGEDAGPANDALIDAFKADVTAFSEKFVRKTSKKTN